MISKLSEKDTAGFVLADVNISSEEDRRRSMIENDLADCIIALPGQLFYTKQIPACLWFMTKNKKEDPEKSFRKREGETLFIDAREMGTMIDRVHKELTHEDLNKITQTYHAWRGEKKDGIYEDIAGYCKAATLKQIAKNDYVLTPGRYLGMADVEDDVVPFEEKMEALSGKLFNHMQESEGLDQAIKENLKVLCYG
jgi:type I restriction enzyme M protein